MSLSVYSGIELHELFDLVHGRRVGPTVVLVQNGVVVEVIDDLEVSYSVSDDVFGDCCIFWLGPGVILSSQHHHRDVLDVLQRNDRDRALVVVVIIVLLLRLVVVLVEIGLTQQLKVVQQLFH